MPLKNRRGEYAWRATRIDFAHLVSDKKAYSQKDDIKLIAGLRIVGGLREAFHPDVWTVAWEDFDKILRLTIKIMVKAQGGLRTRKVAESKKAVRRASFYWSRDPDLPYRIWAMIVPETGGPPIIPHSVEDAKAKMLDVEREFIIPASSLGAGKHKLVAEAECKWGRRSFIEKGQASSRSRPLVIEIE